MILDRLKVIIDADTSGLKKGVKQAQQSLGGVKSAAQQAGQSLNGLNTTDISNLEHLLEKERQKLKDIQKETEEAKRIYRSFQKELNQSTLKEGYYEKKGGTSWNNFIDYQSQLADATEEQRIRVNVLTESLEEQRSKVEQTTDALNKAKDAVKKFNEESKKSDSAGSRGFFSSGGLLKRLLLLRAIRSVISTILRSIKEGIQYLAVYDKKLNGIAGYNKTMSQLATSFEKMKITISVTAMQLLTALSPVLNTLMQTVTWLFERVNEFFAVLQGKKTYTAANPEYWKDYAEAVQESNKKLKETKTLISGFDELNTLSPKQSILGSDNELTIEKEVSALGALAGGLATLLPLLKLLNGLFGDKNNLLKKQTGETNLETEAVRELSGAYNAVPAAVAAAVAAIAGVSALGQAIKLPVIEIDTEAIKSKIQQIRADIQSLAQTVAKPVIEIATETVIPKVQQVRAAIEELNTLVVHPAIELVLANAGAIVQQVQAIATQVAAVAEQVKLTFKTAFLVAALDVSNAVAQMGQKISSFATSAKTTIAQVATQVAVNVGTSVGSMVSNISIKLGQAKQAFQTFTQQVGTNIATWGTGLNTSIQTTFSNILSKISTFTQQAVQKVQTFSINSLTNLKTWASNVNTVLTNWSTGFITKIQSALSSAMTKISNWCSNALSKIGSVFSRIGGSIAGVFNPSSYGDTAPQAEVRHGDSYQLDNNNTATVDIPRTSVVAQPSTEPSPASKLLDKIGGWVKDNKQMLIDAGLAAAAGAVTAAAVAAAIPSGGSSLAVGLPAAGSITAAAGSVAAYNAVEAANQIIENMMPKLPELTNPTILQPFIEWVDDLERLLPAAANGAVLTKPTAVLAGEYKGAKNNPEIVTPENLLTSIINQSNNGLADIYIQVGRQIIQAIEDKDIDISIGDEQIARSAANGNKSYQRRTGKTLFAAV